MLAYIVIGLLAFWISRIESRLNVGIASVSLSVPLAGFWAASATLFMVLTFKVALLVISLGLILLAKLKMFIGAKIALLFGSMAAAVFGIAIGPIGWLVLLIFAVLFMLMLGDAIKSIYMWFFEKLAFALMWVRRTADSARARVKGRWVFAVLAFEVPAVAGVPVYGIWQMMDWFDGSHPLTGWRVFARLVCLAPFACLTYISYLRDTTLPATGGDGLQVPMPISLTDLVGGGPG